MVLRVRTPVVGIWNHFHREFAKKYGLKNVPASRYLSAEQTSKILDIPPERLKSYLINSKDLYGFEWNGVLHVHPLGVIKQISRHFQSKLNEQLRANSRAIARL